MKKIVCSVVMSAAFLAACGDNDSSDKNNKGGTPAPTLTSEFGSLLIPAATDITADGSEIMCFDAKAELTADNGLTAAEVGLGDEDAIADRVLYVSHAEGQSFIDGEVRKPFAKILLKDPQNDDVTVDCATLATALATDDPQARAQAIENTVESMDMMLVALGEEEAATTFKIFDDKEVYIEHEAADDDTPPAATEGFRFIAGDADSSANIVKFTYDAVVAEVPAEADQAAPTKFERPDVDRLLLDEGATLERWNVWGVSNITAIKSAEAPAE